MDRYRVNVLGHRTRAGSPEGSPVVSSTVVRAGDAEEARRRVVGEIVAGSGRTVLDHVSVERLRFGRGAERMFLARAS
ncbi:hypothetical protein ACFFKU_03090 [Kineococcus gynurae]|uniref:Uncharacterized protein n=1 Tax=Kineococcus gynurae TaxID=452979 RepID=A0ABV5LS72_9ACTN